MLEQNRISFEQYLSMTQKSEEEHREEMEPDARERVKRDLVLDAVASAENIQISDDQVAGWLELYAAMGGRRLTAKTVTPGQRANIVTRLRRDKAVSLLVEIATKEETEPETPDADAGPADSAAVADAEREADSVESVETAKEAPKAKKSRTASKSLESNQ